MKKIVEDVNDGGDAQVVSHQPFQGIGELIKKVGGAP